jgi:predicted AlkP superfamily phosphohydrolase/phosphomutase/tetratricopeptide (TPR) repeat protein
MASRWKQKQRARLDPGSPSPRAGRAALLLLVLAAGVFLVWASTVRVRGGEAAFRYSRLGPDGAMVPLPPGWHLSIPGLHRVVRAAPGPLRVAGAARVRSREGIEFAVPYTVTAEIEADGLARLVRDPEGSGPPERLVAAVASRAIGSWAAGSSGEAVVLHRGTPQVEEAIRDRLQEAGLAAVEVRIGRVEGPPGVVAGIEGRALRERISETRLKVAIIGLDGADWEIIDPLMARGLLPNLARLKARGAWGNMKSMSPILSPLLWTSVATGKSPEKHGIIDFLVKDAKTGQAVPVSSRWRKAKALWNIFSDAGRTSAFIAWWATWPAEPVSGYMVSDRVAYSLFGYEAKEEDLAGATYPPEFYREVRPRLVDDSAITLAEVQRFVRVTPAEFAALREQVRAGPKAAYREPVNHLTKILASARSYQAIALEILGRGQPDLFSLYYQGIDEVCHRFAHYMPPKMAMVTGEEFAKYRDAVSAYYAYQDRLLGEVLARLSSDTVVIVLSDHGFKNGSARPPDDPPYIEGKPALWHRRYGIVILSGPAIRPGRLDTTGLLDVAPTVLYLSGLPVGEDMEGRVVVEAIEPRFRERFPVRTIPSYEGIGRPLATGELVAGSGMDEEMTERLRSLGYIGGGGATGGEGAESAAGRGGAKAGGGTGGSEIGAEGEPRGGHEPGAGGVPGAGDDQALVTGHLNEAALHLKAKDYRKAEAALARARAIGPDLTSVVILEARIHAEQKRYGPAIEAARRALSTDPAAERETILMLGRFYADGGRFDEGLSYLRGLARERPGIAEVHAALGALLLKRGESQAAEQELLRALSIDPALSEPLTELHALYRGTARILTLEPIVRKGLSINDRSVVHHNWMGLIHEWKKELGAAEQEFRRAMELDPDYAATMANLGALYGRSGRLEEAVAVLTRAVEKEPENLEAWGNLGAAQGRMGHLREAIAALETARRKGVRTTTLYNALALAYFQDAQRDKAEQYLKESLQIDPAQKDARDLLDAVRRAP